MKVSYLFYIVLPIVLYSCQLEEREVTKESLEENAVSIEDGRADSAIEYNDGLVGVQSRVVREILKMYKTEDPEEMLAICTDARKQVYKGIDVMENLEVYSGGTRMKSLLLEWLHACEKMIDKVELMYEYDEDIEYTEDEYQRFVDAELDLEDGSEFMQYVTNIEEEFFQAQNTFAKKHGFVIHGNPYEAEVNQALEEVE